MQFLTAPTCKHPPCSWTCISAPRNACGGEPSSACGGERYNACGGERYNACGGESGTEQPSSARSDASMPCRLHTTTLAGGREPGDGCRHMAHKLCRCGGMRALGIAGSKCTPTPPGGAAPPRNGARGWSAPCSATAAPAPSAGAVRGGNSCAAACSGRHPVSISHMRTPNAYTSTRSVTCAPRTSASGAMYSGVPAGAAAAGRVCGGWSWMHASPKSESLAVPEGLIRTLEGLRSA
eukprot:365596-Chlamydomonas_euryale.AAC.13